MSELLTAILISCFVGFFLGVLSYLLRFARKRSQEKEDKFYTFLSSMDCHLLDINDSLRVIVTNLVYTCEALTDLYERATIGEEEGTEESTLNR